MQGYLSSLKEKIGGLLEGDIVEHRKVQTRELRSIDLHPINGRVKPILPRQLSLMKELIIALVFLTQPFFVFARYTIDRTLPVDKASVSLPLPAKSEYFKTVTGGIFVDLKKKEIKYMIGLDIIKPFNKTVFAEILFENPENKKMPLIVEQIIKPQDKEITVYSVALHNLKRHTDYNITVLVYEDKQKTRLITKHIQTVRSFIDDGLVAGIDGGIKSILDGDLERGREILKEISEVYKFDFPAISSLAVLDDFNKGIVSREYLNCFFRGLSYHRSNNFNAAIEEFSKAVRINSNYPQAYIYLGIEYIFLRKYKEAIPFLEKCIKIKPDYAEAYWCLATVYDNLKKQKKAKKYLQKARELFRQMGNDRVVEQIDKRLNELNY